MSPILLLSLVGTTPPMPPEQPLRIDIKAPEPCPQTIGTEIVVCGKKGENARYRLKPLAGTPQGQALPQARVGIAPNADLSVETESADMGMARSQRALVRFRLKF